MVERPVQLGQTHEVEALRLNDDGHGVASIHGFTVFVPDLLPGERGLVEITAVERRFARAQLVGAKRRRSTADGAAVPGVRRLRRMPAAAPVLSGAVASQTRNGHASLAPTGETGCPGSSDARHGGAVAVPQSGAGASAV
ncbi:hypothetical protein GCM10025857_13760 [Alicyclobacillus contaminans]|nr:hypothetical protein GCM10025857_13760 [Alicyclobacillus contaminans]